MQLHNQVHQMKNFLQVRKQKHQFDDFWTRRQSKQSATVDPCAIQHEYTAMSQFLEWVDTDGHMLRFKERGGVSSLKHKYESNTWT